jgi:hypothetical protein
MGKIGAD